MQTKTLFPVTALIALVAAAPLAWAQDSHETSATPAGDDAKAHAETHTDSDTVAMAAAQPNTICNDRSNTVACGVKSIPHEPDATPVNPAAQAPAPKQ